MTNENPITQGDDSLTSYDASISKDVLERLAIEGQAAATFVTELETDMNARGISTSFADRSMWAISYTTDTWTVSYRTRSVDFSLNEDLITQGDDSLTSYDASISKDVLERPTVEGQAEAAFVTELETDINGRGISTSFTPMTNWKIPYETTDISSQSDISFLP
jgi:hypothetical protein